MGSQDSLVIWCNGVIWCLGHDQGHKVPTNMPTAAIQSPATAPSCTPKKRTHLTAGASGTVSAAESAVFLGHGAPPTPAASRQPR